MTSAAFLKIQDFKKLPPGWCYGEGLEFSDESIGMATELALFLLQHGFGQLDAFPGTGGEIRVTAYVGDRYLEFTIEPDQIVTFVLERKGEELERREGMILADCMSLIYNLRRELWNLFDLFIADISTSGLGGFRVWPSSRQATGEYLSFAVNVLPAAAGISACTSGGSTYTSAASRRFSGPSTEGYFRKPTISSTRSATPRMPAIGT